jgi:saccharopine dehydrogenase-like NADP-dependent oxidoreductase
MLIAKGEWDCHHMANIEELPPVPFLGLLETMGLPTRLRDPKGDRSFATEKLPEQKKARLGAS